MTMETLIQNETAVVISDLHVGDPDIDPAVKKKGLDDFDRDEDFKRLLADVIPRRAGWPTTLIINGDFIDFIQVLPEFGRHNAGDRFGVTQDRSQLKLERVLKGHPAVFDALGEFLARGGQILVLPGNHDIDLHWPDVFGDLRKRLGDPDQTKLAFIKQGVLQEQGVYIEHGNQYSYDNWFEFWKNPIRNAPDGRKRIERPWGTLFLDLVYNDFKDLYPYSNKIYPHAELAWIALRSFRDDSNVSAKAIARLIVFFASQGKRFLWEHLLGDSSEHGPTASVPNDEVFKSVGQPVNPERLDELRAEVSALEKEQRPKNEIIDSSADQEPLPGLLGRTDDRGMSNRQVDLLQSGEYSLVAFGHTHTAIDGNAKENLIFGAGDKRRFFNTGSWVPAIPIGRNETPYWKDLASKASISELYYLMIELKPSPKGSLERLVSPDKLSV